MAVLRRAKVLRCVRLLVLAVAATVLLTAVLFSWRVANDGVTVAFGSTATRQTNHETTAHVDAGERRINGGVVVVVDNRDEQQQQHLQQQQQQQPQQHQKQTGAPKQSNIKKNRFEL